MSGDRGHLRTMRLLPFAAAATNRLTFSMQTRLMRVDWSRWCRSEAFVGRLRSVPVGVVAALSAALLSPAPCCVRKLRGYGITSALRFLCISVHHWTLRGVCCSGRNAATTPFQGREGP